MSIDRSLLVDFLHEYPFQPATAIWRAVEIGYLCAQPFPEGTGIDLGCGDGRLTRLILDRVGARRLVGVDVDAAETALAADLHLYERIHAVPGAAVPEPAGAFDFVFSNSVLEHIPDLMPVLREAARLLKPGGTFVATVPSDAFHDCLRGPIFPWVARADYLAMIDRRLAHERYWSRAEWAAALDECGLDLEAVSGYFTPAEVRRWETVARFTAGVLYTLFGGAKRPIEIQRTLGMRRGARLPRPAARLLARLLTLGLARADRAAAPRSGCVMVTARKR